MKFYSVIYNAIEDVEASMKGMLKPIYEEVALGSAEIRQVFRSSRFGNIAGSIVRSGIIKRGTKARLVRDGVVVANELSIESLRREKDDVTEGERRRSASALKSATGLIRSEVGKALGIRLTPTISFQLDSLPTTARSIEDALAQAQVRDAAIARAAEGASYAGDANPYRTKDEDEDAATSDSAASAESSESADSAESSESAASSDSAESAASPEEAVHEQDVFADEQDGGIDNRQIAALQAQAMAEAAQADAQGRSSHDQL